ncbi:hypothetical protein, partial [Oceanihabitans sediminis]|uniref:hypothetical protein n=1 Tax=Oceanihabitans sediminis TaxID=1812012 RepID=UPI00299E3DF3
EPLLPAPGLWSWSLAHLRFREAMAPNSFLEAVMPCCAFGALSFFAFLKPALIHFYVEDKYPISTIIIVLKEIAEQFSVLNSKNDSDFFKYNILFEGYDISSIPPPPPPPPLTPNELDIDK